jgi:hypothetical protein
VYVQVKDEIDDEEQEEDISGPGRGQVLSDRANRVSLVNSSNSLEVLLVCCSSAMMVGEASCLVLALLNWLQVPAAFQLQIRLLL